jgi:hypothetical protein
MSLAHELHRYLKPGVHGGKLTAAEVEHFMRTDPAAFRAVARQAQREAIDYSEMGPMERATLQKLFTAWGWTRGATTFAGRFPFQHPWQASTAAALGENEAKKIDNYYMQHGGAPPAWLAGSMPIGKGNNPWLLAGSDINPMETAGQLVQAMGGLTQGQTQSLAGLEAPGPAALLEYGTGVTKYGQQLRGQQRWEQPIQDLISRFEPYAAGKTLFGSKKGGGTFAQGPAAAALQFAGIPLSKATNIKQTAALGLKDLEQNASPADAVRIRLNFDLHSLPQQVAMMQKRGVNVSPHMISQVRGDMEAEAQMKLWQLNYAAAHGAKSFKSLPPINRFQAGVQFLQQHGHISPATAQGYLSQIAGIKDDTLLTSMASTLWGDTGIGVAAKNWKSAVKTATPPSKTPARP